MKKLFLLFLLAFLSKEANSQDIRFYIHDKNKRSTTQSSIEHAKTMEELLPGYPSAWIDSYDSTVITLSQNGISKSIRGNGNHLNPAQIELLQTAQLASELHVSVYYKYHNPVSNILEQNKIKVLFSVLPDKPAEFPGGEKTLYRYLAEACFNHLSESERKSLKTASVQFSIDPSGKVIQVKLQQSSGSAQLDNKLLHTLKTMPVWNAAENSNGQKVNQNFILDANPSGVGGC